MLSRRLEVLLVDDEETVHDAVGSYFEQCELVHAYNVPQGLAAVADLRDLRLALVDLNLPGSDYTDLDHPRGGFDVMRAARARFPAALVVAFTAHLHPRLVNAAQLMGAEYLVKERYRQNCTRLAERLTERDAASSHRTLVQELAVRAGLSRRQEQIVRRAVARLPQQQIADELGISVTTVRTHVSEILSRCGARSLAEIAASIRQRGRGRAV